MTPYELGETGSIDAIVPLLEYLVTGKSNEKRLAASAIYKLSRLFEGQCMQAKSFLIKSLGDDHPQVRQYSLKALSQFALDENEINELTSYFKIESKDYNLNLYKQIFESNGPESKKILANTIKKDDSASIPRANRNINFYENKKGTNVSYDENGEEESDCDISYYEIDSEYIKYQILKTIRINQSYGYPLRNSFLVSILKGGKWN